MTQTTTTRTRITQVATVIVPVTDQDRALDFYEGTLGLEKVSDFRYESGERWTEVAPSGGTTRMSLATARPDRPAGIETGVAYVTDDVDADHAALRARGVDIEPIMRAGAPVRYWAGAPLAGVPAMFLFRDPDGNSFLMVQG